MTAVVVLADGRAMIGTNFGFGNMLWLISRETHTFALKRWLEDMSQRTSGFQDFDLRGLSPADQEEFWIAGAKALNMLLETHGPGFLERENAFGANCLARLLEMRRSELAADPALSFSDFGHVIDWDEVAIDLNDLWSNVANE